jgi:hypothetical protein
MAPVFALLKQNSGRDNLITSAVMELLEFLRYVISALSCSTDLITGLFCVLTGVSLLRSCVLKRPELASLQSCDI